MKNFTIWIQKQQNFHMLDSKTGKKVCIQILKQQNYTLDSKTAKKKFAFEF